MPRFLTELWFVLQLELAAGEPERPGATAKVQHIVTGGPDGEVRHHRVLEDGRLVVAGLGELPDADVTLTQPYGDALAVLRGELDTSVAFMQGRLKVAGDMERLLAVLPLARTPEERDRQRRLAEQTEA